MSGHDHHWIDVTRFGDIAQGLFCNCGVRAWRTFEPVNISDRNDDKAHRTRLIYNDGSAREVLVPHPMQVRPLLLLEEIG